MADMKTGYIIPVGELQQIKRDADASAYKDAKNEVIDILMRWARVKAAQQQTSYTMTITDSQRYEGDACDPEFNLEIKGVNLDDLVADLTSTFNANGYKASYEKGSRQKSTYYRFSISWEE